MSMALSVAYVIFAITVLFVSYVGRNRPTLIVL